MKILFFTRRFYPDIGGVEKHVLEISKRLLLQGHKITIITESPEKFLDYEKIQGIDVYRIMADKQDWFKKFRIWKSMLKMRKLMGDADIVHCHDVFYWYLPFRFLYPQKPVFTTFHGYESYPIKQKAIIMRKISEKLSWGNICIGDFIQKWYGTKPTFVSYGAVDVKSHQVIKSSSNKSDNKDFGLEDLKTRLSAVFMGRVDEQTGVLTYVKSFKILKQMYPKFELTVIGDGKYKRRIDKKVKAIGFQNNPEKHFQNYHFAFVSRYLSILEAFAAKRLVFAVYDNPVKEDYLKMAPFAPFIIIEKDPSLIAKHVQHFIENPTLEKKMINDAYQWVQKQTWEKMVDLYLTLWG